MKIFIVFALIFCFIIFVESLKCISNNEEVQCDDGVKMCGKFTVHKNNGENKMVQGCANQIHFDDALGQQHYCERLGEKTFIEPEGTGTMYCCNYDLCNSSTAKKPMTTIMGFFVSFMTLISLYGYISQISKIIIFWNFDFILHFESQIFELIMDSIYIPAVCIFLVVQLLFFLIVAPVKGISNEDKWIFCTTLFTNVLHKWLFESTVDHIELCEEFHKKGNLLCTKFMNYTTSFDNLTKAQAEHYNIIKESEPFTCTVTKELFIACIGLIFFFGSNDHHQEFLPEIQDEIKPKSLLAKILILSAFLMVFSGPLYIIIAAPVISVTPKLEWLSNSRTVIRLLTHLANTGLFFYFKCIFAIQWKFKWTSEADIIILWMAAIVNFVKAFSRGFINCAFLCSIYTVTDTIFFTLAQIGNLLETCSFYLIILVIERLLLIMDQQDNEKTRKYLSRFTLTFLPLYFCASLISFAAYYNLNALRFFPDGVNSAVGINFIVFIQATYPTSMLFVLTVCLCLASILEKLYQKNYYRLITTQ